MPKSDKLSRFSASLRVALLALLACGVAFAIYIAARNALRDGNELRFETMQLVRDVRQSSDDLTRMARTYVTTGDIRYRDYFEEIVAIRDGLKPRPQEYENIYWDLVVDANRPTPMGAAEPLLQRIANAGFTLEEFTQLKTALEKADLQIALERKAMRLMEASAEHAEPDATRLESLRMLHDDNYRRYKADVMRPLAEANRMVLARTAGLVDSANRSAYMVLIALGLSGLVLTIMLWQIRQNLYAVLGMSPRD